MKITPTYLHEQQRLHALTEYGTISKQYAPIVSQLINKFQVTQLLDYGCGRGNLAKHLQCDHQLTIQQYDPAVPEFAGEPIPMQMVACIDVLEHIEPECLDEVLNDIKRCTNAIAFLTVATGPAQKTLSDGRNAHLIQEPMEWWFDKIASRFEIQTLQRVGDHGFFVVAYAKPDPVIELPEGVQ